MRTGFALLTASLLLGFALSVQPQLGSAQQVSSSSAEEVQVIAGPIPEKVTSNSAVIWWQTTAPAESILIYGNSNEDQRQRVQRPWRTTTHEVSLKRLQPATTYYVDVLQADGSQSGAVQFTTQPQGYSQENSVRITNGPLFEQITPESATIAWSTNVPSSSVIHYGRDAGHLEHTAQAHWTPTTHRVVLRNLQPGTHYYFTIESRQQLPSAEPAPTQIYGFSTLSRGQQALNIG